MRRGIEVFVIEWRRSRCGLSLAEVVVCRVVGGRVLMR